MARPSETVVLHAVKGVDESAQHQKSGAVLLAPAIGTSIDAMSAGGGRAFRQTVGQWAEIVGGGALFALGLSILLRHLYA